MHQPAHGSLGEGTTKETLLLVSHLSSSFAAKKLIFSSFLPLSRKLPFIAKMFKEFASIPSSLFKLQSHFKDAFSVEDMKRAPLSLPGIIHWDSMTDSFQLGITLLLVFFRFPSFLSSLLLLYLRWWWRRPRRRREYSAHRYRPYLLTCFRSRSLLADRHVTRYLVRFRNEPSTSNVKWSRDERCSMNEITRKPRFWIMCCCTVWLLSTSSQIKPSNLELQKGQEEQRMTHQEWQIVAIAEETVGKRENIE